MAQRPLSTPGPGIGELAPLIAAMQQALVELAAVSEKERQSVDMARVEAEHANQNLVDAKATASQRIAAAQETFDDAYRRAAAVGRWPAAEPDTGRPPAGRQRRSHRRNSTASLSGSRTKTPRSAASDSTDSTRTKVPAGEPVGSSPSPSGS